MSRSKTGQRTIDLVLRLGRSWATRSLAVGGVATLLDLLVLLTCVHFLRFPNPLAAMAGVTVGATFTFFANRHFAFKDRKPGLAPQALKFVLATLGSMLVHASFVWFLADRHHVPVVIAKLIADIAVFSVGQLFLLRYLVFPKQKEAPSAEPRGVPALSARGLDRPKRATPKLTGTRPAPAQPR